MGLIKKTTLFLFSLCFLITPLFVQAQASCPTNLTAQKCIEWTLQQTGSKAGYTFNSNLGSENLSTAIGSMVSTVLAFLGALILIMIIIGGVQWMLAQGDEEKAKAAKKRLINALIGLLIVVSAYAITWFVTNRIENIIYQSAQPNKPDIPISDDDEECSMDGQCAYCDDADNAAPFCNQGTCSCVPCTQASDCIIACGGGVNANEIACDDGLCNCSPTPD